MRRLAPTTALLLMSVALSGCRHRVRVFVPPPPHAPVELIAVPQPLLEVAPAPSPTIKVPIASAAAAELQRMHRRAMLKAATPPPIAPVPSPVAPDPGAVAIGSLSTGGDRIPQMRQNAVTLLSDVDRRIGSLSASLAKTKESQIAQVREFQRKSRLALGAGDAQGALTLATKAKLLLDDLLK